MQARHMATRGYVLKDSPAHEIAQAIGAALAGRMFFSKGPAAPVIEARVAAHAAQSFNTA